MTTTASCARPWPVQAAEVARRARYVAIEGPTGVGKTTLATRLGPVLGMRPVLDPFEANPFLAELLAAPQPPLELALRAELTFLALRIAQLRCIGGLLAAGVSVIADWALLKQPVFAAATLGPADAARVAATVEVWRPGGPAPDVLIGLSASAAVLGSRVRRRGRAMESGVTGARLSALSAAFETAYAQQARPLIRLDARTFDVFDDRHLAALAGQVRQFPIPLEPR